jgi:hypothetical protein
VVLTSNALIHPLSFGMMVFNRATYAGSAMIVVVDVIAIFVVIALAERWALISGLGKLGWMRTTSLLTQFTRVSNGAHAM